MSDSLKATVIVIEPVLTISTRPELVVVDDDELLLEPPRLPAVEPALELEPEPDDELDPVLELEPDPDPEPAEIVSPGETLATLTTVPLAGAYRRVSFSAFSALRTVAWAPSTAACAEAILAAIVSALVVLVWPEPDPVPPEPELPPEPLDPLLDEPEDPAPRDVPEDPLPDRVLAGVVVVEVVGVVVVRVVVVVAGVVDVSVVVVCVVVIAAGWNVTNSLDSGASSRLVLVDDPDDPEVVVWFSALVRLSSAEVRFDSACSTVSSAAVGSRVASSCPLMT
jgi:hypothetical protein